MEKIDFKKQNIPFTQVANGVLNDPQLSAGAKGLYAYLYSKPEGWDFAEKRIAKDFKNGTRSVRSGLKELEQASYLIRYKLPNGRMVYKVIFPPLEPELQNVTLGTEPELQIAKVPKCQSAEMQPISNKEIIVIKSISNKDCETGVSPVEIVKVIDLFETVNPTAYKKWYKNKTQRLAVSNLVSLHGLELVTNVVNLLPKSNKMAYMPTITTPDQLENKWEALKSAFEKKKSEITSKQVKLYW